MYACFIKDTISLDSLLHLADHLLFATLEWMLYRIETRSFLTTASPQKVNTNPEMLFSKQSMHGQPREAMHSLTEGRPKRRLVGCLSHINAIGAPSLQPLLKSDSARQRPKELAVNFPF
jgi:hypothetical protein